MTTSPKPIRAFPIGTATPANTKAGYKATPLRTEEERISEEIARAKQKAGLTGRLAGYTFETFNPARHPDAFEAAQNFLQDPGTLILYGPYGTGKTHLAAALAHRYIERDPVINRRGWYDPDAGRWKNADGATGGPALFVVLPDLLRDARGAMNEHGEETEASIIHQLQRRALLVLDDVGRHKASRWAKETLYSIINWKYNYLLPLVITTNLQPNDFLDNLGGGTTDRLVEMATMVEMAGPSYRIETAARRRT